MPTKSQMSVKAFAIWSSLCMFWCASRRVSNVSHKCINLRLTSLSVAILTSMLVVKLQYLNEICTHLYTEYISKRTHIRSKKKNVDPLANKPLWYYIRIGIVFVQLPCETIHISKVCFYAYLSLARIFGIKTLPAYDLASHYTKYHLIVLR